jgi:hypothetical protein
VPNSAIYFMCIISLNHLEVVLTLNSQWIRSMKLWKIIIKLVGNKAGESA